MTISANDVADALLFIAREYGDNLTHLKLQKLVFYADAWHMVLNDGTPLISEQFEAWVHGPVVRSLYDRFRGSSWHPIMDEVSYPHSADESVQNHLKDLYEVFGACSAFELEKMTHDEEPWIQARGGLEPDQACTREIDKALMHSFYSQVAREN